MTKDVLRGAKKNRNTEQEAGTTKLIEGLKAEMLELKKLVLETVEITKKHQTERATTHSYRKPRGCPACLEAQSGERCTHCYKCGQGGHLARGCRQNRGQQGNWTGLLGRDPHQKSKLLIYQSKFLPSSMIMSFGSCPKEQDQGYKRTKLVLVF
uniref:CCHC-type domain-containing protein n=1 Tax=Xiphophorus couchianus TaxID=32473 RepID=A0A3B5LS08_9TELE